MASSFLRLLRRQLIATLLCLPLGVAMAQASRSEFEARTELLERARSAVVGVLSEAVEEAGSIAALGKHRHGSGVVIGDDGLVLTIGYLILEAERVDLIVDGERRVPARIVAYDLASGFGLVQALAPLHVEPVHLGRSAALSPDEPLVVASGRPDSPLSVVRLVSQRAFSGYWEYHIDAALFTVPPRTDHSGAGLFSLDGELLGIGSLVVTDAMGPGRGRLPGNMFVPVDLLKPILAEMRARGASRGSTRAWLGLNCTESGGEVHVLRVTRDSPADAAGVQPGDRILRIDDAEVGALETLWKTLWRDGAERDVTLTIVRDDELQTITVHATDRMKTLRRPQGI
ncbi:S1C family serine protease [uncultured Piscinibacter sp.]|uniref:S1C family serine protease n=1 Tax=uncultured Piscinibacter sp. TaxID=1131835 RepID=UPI002619D1DC|nr:S1C family serine protease [uncultured Piscinibacter sp.]